MSGGAYTIRQVQRVEVEWVDSQGRSGWRDHKEVLREARQDSMLCHTVGYVLEETPAYVLLCASHTAHSATEDVSVGDSIQIPREAIRALHRLRR